MSGILDKVKEKLTPKAANKLRECLVIWEEKPGSNEWNVLAFDAVVKEGHSGACQVTSYPVDSGFRVSDHTIRQNRIIELSAITSNISMSVATSRKDFKSSFGELVTAVVEARRHAAVESPGFEIPGKNTGKADTAALGKYETAKKWGRAKYDNETVSVGIPYTNISMNVSNPLITALTCQVSLAKVDETIAIIDKLNATGQLVHVITMRGTRLNCVLRQYSAENDVSNAYCLPTALVFEQLNVINLGKSRMQVATKDTDAQEVTTQQQRVPVVEAAAATFIMYRFATAKQVVKPKVKKVSTDFSSLAHKSVPFSTEYDTVFLHDGIEYTLGRIRYNPAIESWVSSLSWRLPTGRETVSSLPLQPGVNLVRQYACPLPSLVVVNNDYKGADITTADSLRIYIVEKFDETFGKEE